MKRYYKLTSRDGRVSWLRVWASRRFVPASLFRRQVAEQLARVVASGPGTAKIERVSEGTWRRRPCYPCR